MWHYTMTNTVVENHVLLKVVNNPDLPQNAQIPKRLSGNMQQQQNISYYPQTQDLLDISTIIGVLTARKDQNT